MFEEYRLKNGYDFAPINQPFENNLDPFGRTQQHVEKKRETPYNIELNESMKLGKDGNRPFCQITLNLSKEDFSCEKKM